MITRTGFYPNLIALQTLLRKEILRFMRIWTQTLLPPAITMCLYFLIFGKFIGSQIRHIDGFAYIQFIVPGLSHDVYHDQCFCQHCFFFFSH